MKVTVVGPGSVVEEREPTDVSGALAWDNGVNGTGRARCCNMVSLGNFDTSHYRSR